MTKPIPKLVQRIVRTHADPENRLTYEEANWAKLAPHFRDAHNRLRIMRGLSPIPPPKIDLYIPPKRRKKYERKVIDPQDPELIKAVRAQNPILGPSSIRGVVSEGLTINGVHIK
jgi:hypothetical protein